MKNFSSDANLAAVMAAVMISGMKKKHTAPIRTATPEEIARREKEKERAAWNAAVDAKKAAK